MRVTPSEANSSRARYGSRQWSKARWKVTGVPSAASIRRAAGGLDVDVSVLAEASEYQSVGSRAACHADVFQHRFHFYGGIEEVSSAGADDDVQADVEQAACHCDVLRGALLLLVRQGNSLRSWRTLQMYRFRCSLFVFYYWNTEARRHGDL